MPFADYAQIVLKLEGGLVDHPDDPGGLTNYGISQRSHPWLTRDEIINMTPERAAEIDCAEFWVPIQGAALELISHRLALLALDFAVNSGPYTAIATLQETVHVKPDGLMGPATLAAIRAVGNTKLVEQEYLAGRAVFLTKLKSFPVFGRGWMSRLFAL